MKKTKKPMWICDDCGCRFEEKDAGCYSEHIGDFWGSACYQYFMVCPECESDNIGEEDEEEN